MELPILKLSNHTSVTGCQHGTALLSELFAGDLHAMRSLLREDAGVNVRDAADGTLLFATSEW